MIAFLVPPITIEIADGDLAAQDTDAIVNAANDALWMGAGVAGAIKARGGAQIEAEAMAQGPIAIGACVVTSAGRLPVPRFVIHAAVMGQDLRTSAAFIEEATRNALMTADGLGIESIAFPAFGTGVGGFRHAECARIMLTVIRRQAAAAASVRLVRLVLFGLPAYRTFVEIAGEIVGPPLDGPADCPVSG